MIDKEKESELLPTTEGRALSQFSKDGHFQELVAEDHDDSVLPDAAWAEYQERGDKVALARKRALFFRATFMPSPASALTRVRDGDREDLRAFADRLESGLTAPR